MTPTTTEIISTIGAIQTLIENFPMSIFELFGNKIYNSPIEFIIDVLKQLGISDIELVNKIVEFFFNMPNAAELYGLVGKYIYKKISKPTSEQISQAMSGNSQIATSTSPNYIYEENTNGVKIYYYKTALMPIEIQSEFFNGLEYSVKGIIQNILTGLLSCSVVPEIPSENMDISTTQVIEIPKDVFDISNLFDIYPLGEVGPNFYSGVDDGTMNVNTLYRTNDLNAFIWYVINRGSTGSTIPQTEKNKMMWDSRIESERNGGEEDKRINDEEWEAWIQSKSASTELFYTKEQEAKYTEAYTNCKTDDLPLHPILQFEPSERFGYGNGIKITFPAQTWSGNGIFNKSIYEFNSDYLKNIQIFNPRLIVSEMINSLLNGNITSLLNIKYSTQTKLLEEKINEIIKKALEVDDITVSDCYFSFSNEDFDSALQLMELEKYNAKKLNSETSPAIKLDENLGIESVNEINSMATMNEKISAITRTVYNISSIPTEDKAIRISDKHSMGYNEKWMNDVVLALVKPLAKAILSPKVILLFIINFKIMGIIDIENINTFDKVLDLFYKKIITIIISLVQYIRDRIIEFLFDLFMTTVKPILVKKGIIVLNEKLGAWLTLLTEAIACIPLFDFGRSGPTEIDDVHYADIVQEQTIPETEQSC